MNVDTAQATGHLPAGGIREASARSFTSRSEAIAVIAAALAMRAAFLWLAPKGVVSTDLSTNWTEVVRLLGEGKNPYNDSAFLNWPPIWMQLLFLLHKVSQLSGCDWIRVVQLFTTALDLLALSAALIAFAPYPRQARALLYGWALNPSAVLIACQHCNFDSLLVFWCLLAIGSLAQFERSRSLIDWLCACLFVGLGIVTKTIPLVLTPFLIGAARGLERKQVALGAALVLGPVTLGMSILYVLGPQPITDHVLHYRSFAGWHGITGILNYVGADGWIHAYTKAFPLLLGSVLVSFTWLAWRRRLPQPALILAAGWILLMVPTLGPGYGPQYVMWSLPFLAMSTPLVSGAARAVLIAQLAVTALTLITEYGLFPSHGALWLKLSAAPELVRWSETLSTQRGQTLTRLPMFAASLAWLAMGARELRKLRADT